jgi:hypothetical protein
MLVSGNASTLPLKAAVGVFCTVREPAYPFVVPGTYRQTLSPPQLLAVVTACWLPELPVALPRRVRAQVVPAPESHDAAIAGAAVLTSKPPKETASAAAAATKGLRSRVGPTLSSFAVE